MRYTFTLVLCYAFFVSSLNLAAQVISDDFEGSGTITSWFGDDCGLNIGFNNPFKIGINVSDTVLKYEDIGGQYANVRFDVSPNFGLSVNHSFKLKIYVPSNGITGSQSNQVSLKLQDGTLGAPWSTQSEIIKPIVLDEWQEVIFDFENDAYINLDGNSPPPNTRTDFNRVVIQINGENNNNQVIAYIDDVINDDSTVSGSVFNNLVWSDEFNDVGSVDGNKWFHQTQLIAGDSWANGEVQHYTNRDDNSFVSSGTLKIKAIKETYTDQGHQKQYTSARLNSKFAFKYGRVEVRAKLPSVAGTWPAIWLLGKNINEDGGYWDNQGFGTANWPWCGEIDIMEPNVAKTEILGTWHWNNGGGYQLNSSSITITNTNTSQNFHDYVLEWDSDSMRVYLDGALVNQMATVNPFNQEFYILLNVAMGGNLGGTIDSGFTDDAMEIDYIRVYQKSSLSANNVLYDNKISFYPNPVKNELNIKFPGGTNQTVLVQVFDVSGRLIYKKTHQVSNNKVTYIADSLKSGLYFVRLTTNNTKINSFKFLKK